MGSRGNGSGGMLLLSVNINYLCKFFCIFYCIKLNWYYVSSSWNMKCGSNWTPPPSPFEKTNLNEFRFIWVKHATTKLSVGKIIFFICCTYFLWLVFFQKSFHNIIILKSCRIYSNDAKSLTKTENSYILEGQIKWIDNHI